MLSDASSRAVVFSPVAAGSELAVERAASSSKVLDMADKNVAPYLTNQRIAWRRSLRLNFKV